MKNCFPERELTHLYGVSRITVRLALQELEKRGLVYKKHGKGTYVSEISEPAVDLSQVYSFTEQMKVMGKVPQTIILSFQEIEASEYISQQLMIDIGEHVYELERLRLADGIPMMLERTYIPASLFDGLTIADLDNTALYEVFSKKYNQFIRMAVEEFYASIALDNEAKLLGVREIALSFICYENHTMIRIVLLSIRLALRGLTNFGIGWFISQ